MELILETSTTTAALDEALAKAQGEIDTASKDKVNPAFRSKYADLTSVWEACRPALSKNGIALTQWPLASDDNRLHIITRIAHKGEWMQARFAIPVDKNNAHGFGSAITYAKRFTLSAALGVVADDDDDGNAAVGKKTAPQVGPPAPKPDAMSNGDPLSDWVDDAVKDGLMQGDDRRSTFKRTYVPVAERPTNPEWLEKTKKKVDAAIGTFRLSGQSVETVDAFWQGNAKEFDWIKTHMPDEFARLEKSYMDARDAVEARMPVRNTLMAG